MEALLTAASMLTLEATGYIVLGTLLGVVIGAVPGFTGGMLIALSIPLTFQMGPANALALLVAMYMGSVSGGLVSAILLRLPGTPASVVTTFDGYPLARSGKVGRALGVAASASLVGGVVSWVVLAALAYPLSRLAVNFTPWHYFGLVVVALALITTVSAGSQLKGLLAAIAGMLLALPGDDPSVGAPRLTFGFGSLENGFALLPVFLGIFAVSQLIGAAVAHAPRTEVIDPKLHGVWLRWPDYRTHGRNLARSSLLGTLIGLLPGVGANIGSIVAYGAARRASREPERFGEGSEEGIVASEAANNATVGGALIPLVALGIPGSAIDAILIGALILHGVTPGPLLFQNNPDIFYSILVSCLLSAIMIYFAVIMLARPMLVLVRVPSAYLLPAIFVFCILGAYGSSGRFYDVWVMLGFGVLGFVMERARVPLAPFAIGYVLAPLAETNLRTGLMISGGSFAPLWSSPVNLAMMAVALLIFLAPFAPRLRAAAEVRSRKGTPAGAVFSRWRPEPDKVGGDS
ncbi:tripartite tricarboxylate transporter permease [Geminicoccaceae bacterium 1502E]|nr:tripartite tricarboxylate transporter permease [Geminicoccaceae bacterium 1502E]